MYFPRINTFTKCVFTLLLLYFIEPKRIYAQQKEVVYDALNIPLMADFIAYGQAPRAIDQVAKLSLLNAYLAQNQDEDSVYLMLDYPKNLEASIQKFISNQSIEKLEKALFMHYKSKSYVKLQASKIIELIGFKNKYPNLLVKCIGENNTGGSIDVALYENIKSILSKKFYKTFLIANERHVTKYYYPEEEFYGNKVSAIYLLNNDTLFRNYSVLSIIETSYFIEKENKEGLIKRIAFYGLRNYQKDKINQLEYRNEVFKCIDLWEFLSENNLCYDYLIIFNEMKFNK
jgi:hypothetical protein